MKENHFLSRKLCGRSLRTDQMLVAAPEQCLPLGEPRPVTLS